LNQEKSLKETQSFMDNLIGELVLQKGIRIDKMILQERLQSNQIYETWKVKRDDDYGSKIFYAHIFKYQLNNNFPIKAANLTLFCNKINQLNKVLDSRKVRMNSLTCLNNTYVKYVTPTYEASYILFKPPQLSESINELCGANCAHERVCKYRLRDIARALVDTEVVNAKDCTLFSVGIHFNKKFLYYGLFKNRQNRIFTFLPFFDFEDLAYVVDETPTENSIKLMEKKAMVNLGKFLMELYTGHQTHEKEIKYQNLTDAYLDLNYDPKKKKLYCWIRTLFRNNKKIPKRVKTLLSRRNS